MLLLLVVGGVVGGWVSGRGPLLVLKASKDGPANHSSSIWPRCDSAPCLCVHSQMSAPVEPTGCRVWDVSGQVFKRQRSPKRSGQEREGSDCYEPAADSFSAPAVSREDLHEQFSGKAVAEDSQQ